MKRLRYKIADKCVTGQTIACILGQSAVAAVYTTKDNHLRWEYFANHRKLPKDLKPAVHEFDTLMTRVAQLTLDPTAKRPLYHLLGKSLFSAFDAGLDNSVSSYFRSVEELIAAAARPPKGLAPKRKSTRRVFIVHGRDDAAKEGLARYLSQLELTPIILHEQSSGGKTIIEKFETHADVDFAVVLLTPDDLGGLNDGSSQTKPRARQNVILELGFFFGSLGRGRVAALHKGELELPSDYDGIIFIQMDSAGAWKMTLAREIKNAGIKIDLNKA
jgi:predicted nucleotide-binding protein